MLATTNKPVIDTRFREKPFTFRAFVETHQRTVYYLALDLTGNHHDAEDLSQEVFIKAHRALDSFRGDASVKSWLYRIAVNTYLNKRRKKALAFMTLQEDFDLEHSAYAQPDAGAEAERMRHHMAEAMKKLSPKERSAFVLRYRQDLPIKEVAAALNVADGTVKSLLFRAVKKLRKTLVMYKPE